MSSHTIKVTQTTNEAIVKFESNEFLVKNHSYEFNNIDEAKPSPLAQQLFHLPFVKTVYLAQNFVAIERYDIVQWQDVQDAVAAQIEEYLNGDTPLLPNEDLERVKKTAITIYAEATPNPSVMKYVANKKLVVEQQEFKSVEDTVAGTLSRKLYQFPFVKEIYVDENFLSVHKHDIVEWAEVNNQIRGFIKESLENGDEIGQSKQQSGTRIKKGEDVGLPKFENLSDTSKKIVEILDEYVKPAVASDGGNIVFDSYEEQTQEVKVILQGACSGCPSSTMTLRNGIETMLKEMIPGKIGRVVALNG
ncbi:NifU family protein [Nonlabens ponticola]|uniref:NifU family protein n=1 Tax=Nonlabens ponticola TaxID=2496866 RepID=A0A3S9MW06_9FLAO|nr:NifU family protein [Nonlabens ponticola]AZQ43319.1 NifU family protein [Nonlabens ponticola]